MLVGINRQCESGFRLTHSGSPLKVSAHCEQGHILLGDEDDPEIEVCAGCWLHLMKQLEDGKLSYCSQCDRKCGMDFTATWENGRTAAFHQVPHEAEKPQWWEDRR